MVIEILSRPPSEIARWYSGEDSPVSIPRPAVHRPPTRYDARGNCWVYAPPPVNLRLEYEHMVREERLREECAKLGVPFIYGAAAGNWTFTNNTRTYILNGAFDWDTDSFSEALYLSTSDLGASSTTYPASNQHANANGYTTGGIAATMTLSGTTTVTVDNTTNPVWTASGGSIVARFGELHEVAGNIACYFLLDSAPADVTVTDGNTLTITHHANGVFQLA